jgi:hypothetical protein
MSAETDSPEADPAEDDTDDAAPRGLRRLKPPPERKLSQILEDFAADASRQRISLADLKEAMEGRAFGALMLIFAFPNILPSPPGLAGVLGLPLLFLSFQMMLGRAPWLPEFIGRRSMTREAFATVFNRATPLVARAERLLRQRLWLLTWGPAQQVLGVVCLILSVLLMLPIPFGNMAPSVAICLIALGVLERDGVWVLAGLVAAVGAAAWVGGIAYALFKSAIFVVMNAF